MSDKPKTNHKTDAEEKQHPFYLPFTYQISAALAQARQIKADMQSETPPFVQKFLKEFDKKAA